jgi:hypothetical protein
MYKARDIKWLKRAIKIMVAFILGLIIGISL